MNVATKSITLARVAQVLFLSSLVISYVRADNGGVRASRVLHISIDGLRPPHGFKYYHSLPNFNRIYEEGSSTDNARTSESTQTLPSHTSQFTGRDVRDHHMAEDVWKSGDRLDPLLNGENVFDVVDSHGGSACMFVSKEKFQLFLDSWDGISHYFEDKDSQQVTNEWKRMKRWCTYSFLHLKSPDQAGHRFGGADNKQYEKAVMEIDEMLGQILEEVEPDTVLIVTTDHGFEMRGNHAPSDGIDNYRIPFFVHGPGVAKGADLYTLNTISNRLDPGDSAADIYTSGPQPIRNKSAAPLALDILGMSPSDGALSNDLKVTLRSVPSPGPAEPQTAITSTTASSSLEQSNPSPIPAPVTTTTTKSQILPGFNVAGASDTVGALSDSCDHKNDRGKSCKSDDDCCSDYCRVKTQGKNKRKRICGKVSIDSRSKDRGADATNLAGETQSMKSSDIGGDEILERSHSLTDSCDNKKNRGQQCSINDDCCSHYCREKKQGKKKKKKKRRACSKVKR